MTRQRSPKYPNISLAEALHRVRLVFDKDRSNPLDREVVAQHMGYSGLSGASDKVIGSIMQFGLFERVAKGEIRVSQRAIDIFHPDTTSQRNEALRSAAFAPETFRLLRDRFGSELPSESAMRSALVRMEYLDRAIGPIVDAYSETLQFLKQEGATESGGAPQEKPTESMPTPPIEGRLNVQLEGAKMEAHGSIPPPHGEIRQASFVIPLGNGTSATVTYPSDLDADGFNDLKDYLDLFIKKQLRGAAALKQATDDVPTKGEC